MGTASNYATSSRSLKQFLAYRKKRSERRSFEDIIVSFLNEYETWMLQKGNSISTVGIYLRPLRTLFNTAKEEGKVDQDFTHLVNVNTKHQPDEIIKTHLIRKTSKTVSF